MEYIFYVKKIIKKGLQKDFKCIECLVFSDKDRILNIWNDSH
jgi:hypothetical protein